MITKDIKKYLVGNDFVDQNISVKGFPFACIQFSVDTLIEGTLIQFSLFATKDGTTPDTSSERAVAYIGGKKIVNTYSIGKAGKYFVYIDLTGVTNLRTYVSNNGGNDYSASLYLSQEPFVQDYIKTQRFFQTERSCTYKTNGFGLMKITLDLTDETPNQSKFTFTSGSKSLIGYANGRRYSGYINLLQGKYDIVVDCSEVDEVTFSSTNNREFFAIIQFSNDESLIDDSNRIIDYNVQSLVKSTNGAKQIDIDYCLTAAVPGNTLLWLEGTSDGSTWTSIDFIETIKNLYCAGSVNIQKYGEGKIYANVETYTQIRLRFDNTTNHNGSVYFNKIVLHEEYVQGRNIPIVFASHNTSHLLRGYQYFKFKFAKEGFVNGTNTVSSATNCSPSIMIVGPNDEITGTPMKELEQYNLAMNRVSEPTIVYRWTIKGTPAGGGFIYRIKEPVQDGWFVLATQPRLENYILNLVVNCTMYTESPTPENFLKKISEKTDYDIYQLPSQNENKDVFFDDILEWEDNKLIYYQGGYAGLIYEIPFGADNVAHYVDGETIKFAYLLPFKHSNRNASQEQFYGSPRICVFTNTRVYHNFPVRSGNINPWSDMFLFDESAVINPYKKFYVNDNPSASGIYKYFPVLKDYDYNQFDGRIGTTGDADPYGNGGLPSGVVFQDIPDSNYQFWTRLRHSNMTKGFKMCCFGNYNADVCSEPIVMISTNGGRTWYVKAYFACTDYYPYMRGGRIDLNLLFDTISGYTYTSGDLKLCRKRFNIPTEENKEPSTPFILNAQEETLITSISYNNGNCVITTADNVDYDGDFPCVYLKNMSGNSRLDCICNNNLQSNGSNNTGIFFRVEKIEANQYKLYADLGNPNEGNMVCRHIHAVNAIEAGIIISTGESYNEGHYAGGFIYVLSQVFKNGTVDIDPTTSMDVIRLTSTPNGCNRASGAFLFSDNADPTLLYVSDEAFIASPSSSYSKKRYARLPEGRTGELPITPGGIYIGKLSDVDDQSKFTCVCEVGHTVVGLVEKNSHFGADLHPSGIALSKNGFDWNIEIESKYHINGYDNQGNIYFGDKVAVFK